MTRESAAHDDDTRIFRGLLDARFDTGPVRRHAPGTAAGEEEVLLEPSAEVLDFLLGPPPEMVRAVRPKLDNTRPVRERRAGEIVGHRLEIRQVIGEDRGTFVATTFFMYTAGELAAGELPKLRKQRSGYEDPQHARLMQPSGEALYADLGPLRSYTQNTELGSNEITELFRFIGGCVCREPRESD